MISFLTLLLTVGTSADSSADSIAALNAIAHSNSSTPISATGFNEEINKLLRRYPGNDAQNNQQSNSNSNPPVDNTGAGSAPQRGQQPQKPASDPQDRNQPIGQRPSNSQFQQGQQGRQGQQGQEGQQPEQGQQGRQNQYGQYPSRYNQPPNQGPGNQYGQSRYGQNPYGQYGQNGQNSYGQHPYGGGYGGGHNQYGQPQGQYGQRQPPQGQPPQQGQYQGSNDQGNPDQGQDQGGQDQGSSYGYQQPYQGDSGEINNNIFLRKLQQICNKVIQTLIGYTADVINGNTNPFSDGFDSATLKISRDISAVALAFRETPNGSPATYYLGQRILPPVIYDATLYTNNLYYKYINYHNNVPGSGQDSNSDPYADIPSSGDGNDGQFVQFFPGVGNSSTRTTSALEGNILVAPGPPTAEGYNSGSQGQSSYGEPANSPAAGPNDSEEPSAAPVAPGAPKQPKAPQASEASNSQSGKKSPPYALAPPINGPNNSQQQAPAPGAPGSGTLSSGQPLPQLRDTTVRHLQAYLSGMHQLITVGQSYQVYTRDLEAAVDNLEKFVQACTRSQY